MRSTFFTFCFLFTVQVRAFAPNLPLAKKIVVGTCVSSSKNLFEGNTLGKLRVLRRSDFALRNLQASTTSVATSTFKITANADAVFLVKKFPVTAVGGLGEKINKLVGAFKVLKEAEANGGKRPIQEIFEFDWTDGSSHLRFESNPNLFTNAFNAKVFVLFEDEQLRVSSQMGLTELVDAVKDFKARNPT